MKSIYIAILVLLSCFYGSQSFAQGLCFHKHVNNYVYVPYYAPVATYSYNSYYYYQQPLVTVVVQNYRLVPIMENRVEYMPAVGQHFMNYSHYYYNPVYYNNNNYFYNNWHHYNY